MQRLEIGEQEPGNKPWNIRAEKIIITGRAIGVIPRGWGIYHGVLNNWAQWWGITGVLLAHF